MKRVLVFATVGVVLGASLVWGAAVARAHRQTRIVPNRPSGAQPVVLHNGWRLTPYGDSLTLPGDMPATILRIPDTTLVAVNTCGYHDHSLSLIDINSKEVVQKIDLGRDWIGMAYDPSRHEIFISGGSSKKYVPRRGTALGTAKSGAILCWKLKGNQFSEQDPISIPGLDEPERFVSGIASDGKGNLFVANIQTDTVYRLSGADLTQVASKQVAYRPYAVALSPDGQTLAVSNWGDGSVSLLNPETLEVRTTLSVGKHTNALLYAPNGSLFAANAGSNTVSVIGHDRVEGSINVSLGGDPRLGATPVALATDGSNLFVADADDNAVAVVSLHGASSVSGFIPTGRYPSALCFSGGKLLIGTSKGFNDSPNPPTVYEANPEDNKSPYVASLMTGHLTFVSAPSSAELKHLTDECIADRAPLPATVSRDMQRAIAADAFSKIKHVVYVIKENRTYDQVLGDITEGNGDPRITMYGKAITPNQHMLSKDFVLLDNLYTDGEVSQCGHQWTDAAYSNDYTEKQWVLDYSDRGEVESDDRMFTSPGGYLWQDVARHGLKTRIYGEYLQWQEDHTSAHGEVKADPEKFGCSAAFEKVFANRGRDTEKVQVFLSEMKASEKTGVWPNFMVMALNEDHTQGASAGAHTPRACVGNNDLAVGQLIEGLSNSPFWKSTAVFVIEDDAQDGSDHVDCHRTEGYVVSPYTRKGSVDSTMYSTCSMIRTMETILRIPPMSQYDERAAVMWNAFTTKPDFEPYTALQPEIDLNERNPEKGVLAMRSAKLDFSDVDRADPQELNDILWQTAFPGTKMPAPVVGRFRR